MLPGKVYRPEDVVRILRKRAWLVLVPWALVAAATAVVARKLPDTYMSQAMIQVIPPRVPDSIVRTVAPARLEDRLQAARVNILSRTRLERLIQDLDLYQKERASGEIMQDIIEQMQRDIVVTPVKGDAFTVSYFGRDRRQVKDVAERLSGFFIEESLKDGERRAENTQDFVKSQAEESLRKLREVEDKVTKYRMAHANELPQQLNSNQSAVQSTQQQLGLIVQSMEADTNTRLSIERQLAALEAGADPGTSSAAPPPGADGTAAQRLENLRRELANGQARGYGPDHPTIKRLTSAIEVAKKEADIEALRNPVAVGGGLSPAETRRRALIASLQNDLEEVKKRIVQKQAEEKRLRDNIAIYQARVDRAPTRDTELGELTRDYDVLKKTYDSMVASREQANMTVNVERRQIGEQFVPLDPARVPERPISPNRPLINVFGIIGGLAVGLALVAFMEYRDQTFKTDTELGSYVALPVLAVVPLMQSGTEQKVAFRQRVLLNAGCGATVLVCVMLLTYTFVR